MKLELDHVLRVRPPWRTGRLTECGLAVAEADGVQGVRNVVGRDVWVDRAKELGQQRMAMTVCMTCFGKFKDNWQETFATHPGEVVRRDASRFRFHESDRTELAEWAAIATLIETHRDEFDALIAGQLDTVSLADLRTKKAARRRMAQR